MATAGRHAVAHQPTAPNPEQTFAQPQRPLQAVFPTGLIAVRAAHGTGGMLARHTATR